MKKLIAAAALAPLLAFAGGTVTNKFLTVDQHGRLNTAGVATVESVVSNAVKVQVAQAKAEAASLAAATVDEDTTMLAANIVSNRVTIFRGSHSDGFSAMVVITEADKLACKDFKLLSYSGRVATFQLDYVCLADIRAMKPVVKANDHCTAKAEFVTVPASAVILDPANPHEETWEAGDVTYSNFYRLTFTQELETYPDQYFLYIAADGDAPSSGGAGMDLPNGVKGGISCTVGNGWDVEIYKGLAVGHQE